MTAAASSEGPSSGSNRAVLSVIAGLICVMLIAALNLTLVAPAMPAIVAELGGLDNYSWIVLSSMLASTIVVPIVGKLSDLYGRKPFYMAGIVIFMLGSAMSGLAQSFELLVAARAIQGMGMGTMMPLSQAILGDVVSPRERGKYQGTMGAVYGFATIAGPIIGGLITHHLSWRWLFFVNIPVGVLALAVIQVYMHVPHTKRPHVIDMWGIVTLALGLSSMLLATEMGGSQFPWISPQIIGLYALGIAMMALFVYIETRAAEPVLPLRLWSMSAFTLSNIAIMGVAMAMFGAIYFVPIFVQGVIGNSVGDTGTILMPLMLTMVVGNIVVGRFITKTGRYKLPTLLGLASMGLGFWLLTRMNVHSENAVVVRNLALIGTGLGLSLQTFTLIVQNAVAREDLGVATSAAQLSRSIGAAIGVAVMGTLLSQGLATDVPKHLPPGAVAEVEASGMKLGAGSALDPAKMTQLPPDALQGIRAGIADALHTVYTAGVPFVALALLATLFIRETPLRQTAHVDLRESRKAARSNP